MKNLRACLVLLFALAALPAFGQQGMPGTIMGAPPAGPIIGTTTNDSACTGCVGEVISAGGPPSSATVTITIAAPGVVSWTAHGLALGSPVNLTTTGALPTGLSTATTYWVIPIDANSFKLASSIANAIAGTAITTSGTQSGTQTADAEAVLATGTAADVAFVRLTAGDWLICGQIDVDPAGSTVTTSFGGWVNGTSATAPSTYPERATRLDLRGQSMTGGNFSMALSCFRKSLAATTTYYLGASVAFSTSSNFAFGNIWATRPR